MSKDKPETTVNKTTSKKIEDISKLPNYILLEMLDRQKKLFSNRAALEKLPDKGIKIKQIKKQIEDELEKRSSDSNLCNVMGGLTLSASNINAFEWTKTIEAKKETFPDQLNESETNPFKILATHSGTEFSKEPIRTVEQQYPLITEKDIEEIYALKLRNKIDKVEPTNKFLPHKTLNHKYCSKKLPCYYNPQNLCSAYEPPSKFGSVKTISLESSLKLQYEQDQQLKEIQLKHAAERLKDKTYTIGSTLPSIEKLLTYREPAMINSDSENDEEIILEVEDECAGEDREGVVSFNITD